MNCSFMFTSRLGALPSGPIYRVRRNVLYRASHTQRAPMHPSSHSGQTTALGQWSELWQPHACQHVALCLLSVPGPAETESVSESKRSSVARRERASRRVRATIPIPDMMSSKTVIAAAHWVSMPGSVSQSSRNIVESMSPSLDFFDAASATCQQMIRCARVVARMLMTT